MVNGAPQRLPPHGCINPVQLHDEITWEGNRSIVVSARVGKAQVEIRGLGNVSVSPQMLDRAHITALHMMEHIVGIATENLSGGFEENPFGCRSDALARESSVINTVFAANQICGYQRTVHPQHDAS